MYLATRAGLAAVDLELPPARINLRTYAHDLELTSLMLDLEREYRPESVSTEREMRAADTAPVAASTARPRFARSLAGALGQLEFTPAGYPRLHFPDCAGTEAVGEIADGMLAIELERTRKGRARLRRILRGYIAARHVSAVRYSAVGNRVRELVETEVTAQRAHGVIEVRIWPPHSNPTNRFLGPREPAAARDSA